MADSVERYQQEGGVGKATTDLMWLTVAPAVYMTFMKSGGEEKDWRKYLIDVGSYAFAGIPLVRDMVNLGLKRSGFGSISPTVLAPLQEGGEVIAELTRPLRGKTKASRTIRPGKLGENALKLAGYQFGLPSQQAWTTYSGYRDLKDKETDNPLRLLMSKYQLGEDKYSAFSKDIEESARFAKKEAQKYRDDKTYYKGKFYSKLLYKLNKAVKEYKRATTTEETTRAMLRIQTISDAIKQSDVKKEN